MSIFCLSPFCQKLVGSFLGKGDDRSKNSFVSSTCIQQALQKLTLRQVSARWGSPGGMYTLVYVLPPWAKPKFSTGKAVQAYSSSWDCHNTLQWQASRNKHLPEHFKLRLWSGLANATTTGRDPAGHVYCVKSSKGTRVAS